MQAHARCIVILLGLSGSLLHAEKKPFKIKPSMEMSLMEKMIVKPILSTQTSALRKSILQIANDHHVTPQKAASLLKDSLSLRLDKLKEQGGFYNWGILQAMGIDTDFDTIAVTNEQVIQEMNKGLDLVQQWVDNYKIDLKDKRLNGIEMRLRSFDHLTLEMQKDLIKRLKENKDPGIDIKEPDKVVVAPKLSTPVKLISKIFINEPLDEEIALRDMFNDATPDQRAGMVQGLIQLRKRKKRPVSYVDKEEEAAKLSQYEYDQGRITGLVFGELLKEIDKLAMQVGGL